MSEYRHSDMLSRKWLKWVRRSFMVFCGCSFIVCGFGVFVQTADAQRRSADEIMQAQRSAIDPLLALDGTWKGKGYFSTPETNERHFVLQRQVSSLLNGSVLVFESKAVTTDEPSRVLFNEFRSITFDVMKSHYTMHSNHNGSAVTNTIRITESGYEWETEFLGTTSYFVAEYVDNKWTEYGEQRYKNGRKFRFYELTLERISE